MLVKANKVNLKVPYCKIVLKIDKKLEYLGTCDEVIKDDDYKYIIKIRDESFIYILTHELMHCVDFICERFGFKDTEFRAYLIQYLMIKFTKENNKIKE